MGKKFPDKKGKVYVAGWGMEQNGFGNGRIRCMTDNYDPSPFTECKFPFMVRNLRWERCLHGISPIATNKLWDISCVNN